MVAALTEAIRPTPAAAGPAAGAVAADGATKKPVENGVLAGTTGVAGLACRMEDTLMSGSAGTGANEIREIHSAVQTLFVLSPQSVGAKP